MHLRKRPLPLDVDQLNRLVDLIGHEQATFLLGFAVAYPNNETKQPAKNEAVKIDRLFRLCARFLETASSKREYLRDWIYKNKTGIRSNLNHGDNEWANYVEFVTRRALVAY